MYIPIHIKIRKKVIGSPSPLRWAKVRICFTFVGRCSLVWRHFIKWLLRRVFCLVSVHAISRILFSAWLASCSVVGTSSDSWCVSEICVIVINHITLLSIVIEQNTIFSFQIPPENVLKNPRARRTPSPAKYICTEQLSTVSKGTPWEAKRLINMSRWAGGDTRSV